MIVVKKIAEKNYNELFDMYYDYYQSVFGKNWTDNIPIEKIRNFLDTNKTYAEYSTKTAFLEAAPAGMIDKSVLGLYLGDNLLGFTCVGIFEDNTGGIYHIYVKPEYRRKFIDNFTLEKNAMKYLMDGIEEYFNSNNVNNVELEVPHSLNSLKKIVEKEGFVPKFDYYDATKYIKER